MARIDAFFAKHFKSDSEDVSKTASPTSQFGLPQIPFSPAKKKQQPTKKKKRPVPKTKKMVEYQASFVTALKADIIQRKLSSQSFSSDNSDEP